MDGERKGKFRIEEPGLTGGGDGKEGAFFKNHETQTLSFEILNVI